MARGFALVSTCVEIALGFHAGFEAQLQLYKIANWDHYGSGVEQPLAHGGVQRRVPAVRAGGAKPCEQPLLRERDERKRPVARAEQ